MSMAELKRSVECPDTDTPRPVPLLEREERQAAQVRRLRGLDCSGQHEPAHALVDRAFLSYTKNQLARIEWKEGEAFKALIRRP